ncbi:hypothetical protein Mgra_00006804 [Meloidogyne graminicola]|uniref:Uncharacterized protein n=1 Tax=Meloidogyne graminicola TaxID=189291 RepID=A0A8S9ZKX2_9BILA|nr:hypothetical protein Mgra_00006804 [Meloidogyne graminicola]
MRGTEMSFIRDRKDLERKMFKIRRNVFPPILTNRVPQNSAQRSSKHKEARKVRFHVSEPSSSYSQSSGDISSSSNDEQEELCNQNTQSLSNTNCTNSINNEEKKAKIIEETSKNNFYFKYSAIINYEKDDDEMSHLSSCSSNSSNYVENEWSDLEGNTQQRSRETQEAEIKEQFKEAFSHLSKGEYEKTASICTLILTHPIMQTFYVADWEAFDWTENGRKKGVGEGSIIHSDMAKIFFNINLAMIGIAENPLPFYIQSLSIHPELKDLWFLAGIAASKLKDWRSARFCFGHCDDEIRTIEALLLVNFCEQNFLECSFTLNKLFKIYPKHELGLFIYSFILQNFPFWKEFYDQIFKEELIKIDNYKFKNLFNKLEQITKNTTKFIQFSLFSNNLIKELLPKYSPLRIKLRNDMRMEDLGICLCNIFDRVENFSSFAEQKIIFYMDTNTEETQKENSTSKDENYLKNNINKNCNKFQDKDSNGIASQKAALDQIDGTTTSENEPNTTFSSDIEIIEEERTKLTTTTPKTSIKTNAQNEYYFNGNFKNNNNSTPKLNNIRRPLCWAEKNKFWTKLRQKYKQRSQRNKIERENDASLRRSQRVQNSPKYFNIAESWAWNLKLSGKELKYFTKLIRLAHNSLTNKVPDPLINYRWIEELPCINPLIEKFVDASNNENWELSEYLFNFLQFVCEKKNVGLTLGQAEVFRQVYIRWSSTFLNLTTKNASIETNLYIHQMAAELGSHRALSILQLYLDGEFIKNFKQNINSSQKINKLAEETTTDLSLFKNSELEKSQIDLFKWIFERIEAEQKEKLDNSKTMEFDNTIEINSDSEQNRRLRDLKIRYRWSGFIFKNFLLLIANLQPNELGLLQQQSSESIHFILIYCQIKKALNELLNSENNKDIKLYTNANFGINCLSKRNLEEFLKKKVAEFDDS